MITYYVKKIQNGPIDYSKHYCTLKKIERKECVFFLKMFIKPGSPSGQSSPAGPELRH